MTTKPLVFLALGSASAGVMAHNIDITHTHSPDGLTLALLALGAILASVTVAALLVWQQHRRQARRSRP